MSNFTTHAICHELMHLESSESHLSKSGLIGISFSCYPWVYWVL